MYNNHHYHNHHGNDNFGHDNPNFVSDAVYTIPGEPQRHITEFYPGKYNNPAFVKNYKSSSPPAKFNVHDANLNDKKNHPEMSKLPQPEKSQPERDNWGKGIEFLLSCIAMSVGLGNKTFYCWSFDELVINFIMINR